MRAIADVQAQLALSRLRVHAVHRLARLAFDDDVAPETGRKAAHALLTVDLDRVGADMPPLDPGGDGDDDEFTREIRSLRAALTPAKLDAPAPVAADVNPSAGSASTCERGADGLHRIADGLTPAASRDAL